MTFIEHLLARAEAMLSAGHYSGLCDQAMKWEPHGMRAEYFPTYMVLIKVIWTKFLFISKRVLFISSRQSKARMRRWWGKYEQWSIMSFAITLIFRDMIMTIQCRGHEGDGRFSYHRAFSILIYLILIKESSRLLSMTPPLFTRAISVTMKRK